MGDACDDEQCSICYEAILSQQTAALPCGHVYHALCIETWLAQSKCCPQCKVKTRESQVRWLQYDVVPVLSESDAQIRRHLALDPEARQRRLRELREEWRQARNDLKRMVVDEQSYNDQGQAARVLRKDVEEQHRLQQHELEALKQEHGEAMHKCHEVRTHYDEKISQHLSRLPIADPRDTDADLLEEKRKLRHTSPEDRAETLHKELGSSMAQKAEAHREKVERINLAAGSESERDRLQAEVQQLVQAQAQQKASREASQADAISIGAMKKELLNPAKAPKAAQAKRARGHEEASAAAEDDMLDFAGPSKLRRATSPRFGLAPMSQAPAPSIRAQKAGPPVALPKEKSRSLKALFAR